MEMDVMGAGNASQLKFRSYQAAINATKEFL